MVRSTSQQLGHVLGDGPWLAADLPVLILPWEEVSMVRVLPEYTSCR